MLVRSLPHVEEFLKLLETAYTDYKDSYAQDEGLISEYTYNEAKAQYSEEDMAKIDSFIVEHGLKTVGTGILLPMWSRFEDAHMPALSDGLVNKPVREDIDDLAYTLFSPKDFTAYTGLTGLDVVTVKLGYKAVIPKNKALVLSIYPGLEDSLLLCGPHMLTKYMDELTVSFIPIKNVDIKRNQGLVKAGLVDLQTMDTDSFVPRKKVSKNVINDTQLDIEIVPPAVENANVETVVA